MTKIKIPPIKHADLNLLPAKFAMENTLIPLRQKDETLYIAVTDENNFSLIQDVMMLTGKNVIPEVYDAAIITKAIEDYYQIKIPRQTKIEQIKEFKVLGKDREKYHSDQDSQDDISVINHINEIITTAINGGASDIHFEPYERVFRVRFRQDGKLKEILTLSLKKKFAYISRIKIMAELDIAEKRRPQDGRIRMGGGNKVVDIRVSTMPTDFGEKIVLRLLDKSNLKLDLDTIGFTEAMTRQFKDVLASAYGMILVTGPTGSGKTTTLYSALNTLNKSDVNIMTIEDPIEYNLEGINQGHVRADIGFTFAGALRSFLRQDPDIIMVGEIRDAETAEIAIRSALTGHLVLSTLHTNDAASAITRLVEMGIEPFLVATSVKMVLAQRLVRKICSHCKEPVVVDEILLKRLNFSSENKIYAGKGCEYCNNTGYSGRTALIEMLPVTEKVSELIINNASAAKIRHESLKNGMLTLRQHGLEKLRRGDTTIEEVLRETMI
jgi:type IV pilus assembly protein PilB